MTIACSLTLSTATEPEAIVRRMLPCWSCPAPGLMQETSNGDPFIEMLTMTKCATGLSPEVQRPETREGKRL